MSVRVQVSSMKPSRSASTRPWYFVHWLRRRATSGRSRSPATTLFFEAELLGMDELPYRTVIDLQAALGKFGHEPAQGEVAFPNALSQPDGMFARDRLWLVTAHLAGFDAAGLVLALGPIDGRANRDPKLFGGLIAGHAAFDRRHNPLPKVKRIRGSHPCWPPSQPAW